MIAEPQTAPTTFEPDWDELYFAYDSNDQEDSGMSDMYAVITEYHRQIAAAGLVVVSRKDLAQVVRWKVPEQEAIDRLQAILS